MPNWEEPYEVEPLDHFKETMKSLKQSYPRLEVAIGVAIKFLRIRPAEAFDGIVIGRDDWKYFRVEAAPGVPTLNVFLRIDEGQRKVYLIRADLCEEESEDEDDPTNKG